VNKTAVSAAPLAKCI